MGLLYGLLVGIGIVAALVFLANKPENQEAQIASEIEKDDTRKSVRWLSLSIVIIIFCMLIGSCIASAAS